VNFLNKKVMTQVFSHCSFNTCRAYMLKRRVINCFYLLFVKLLRCH